MRPSHSKSKKPPVRGRATGRPRALSEDSRLPGTSLPHQQLYGWWQELMSDGPNPYPMLVGLSKSLYTIYTIKFENTSFSFKRGGRLGSGSYGRVYELELQDGDDFPPCVLKLCHLQKGMAAHKPPISMRQAHVQTAWYGSGYGVVYDPSRQLPNFQPILLPAAPGVNLKKFIDKALSTADLRRHALRSSLKLIDAVKEGRKKIGLLAHRDITPRNVMYDAETETLTLVDFDFAVLSKTYDPEQAYECRTTPGFCAPEQYAFLPTGSAVSVQPGTDVFSIAQTILFALTGAYPACMPGIILHHIAACLNEKVFSEDEITWPQIVSDVSRRISKRPEDAEYEKQKFLVDLENTNKDLHGELISQAPLSNPEKIKSVFDRLLQYSHHQAVAPSVRIVVA